MRRLVTGEQMREVDRYAVKEVTLPSLVLMERAALCVAETVLSEIKMEGAVSEYSGEKKKIWVACGVGNNGADGMACARILHLRGCQVTVILAGDEDSATSEWRIQREIAENLEMNVISFDDFLPGACDLLVDAVFGVGLNREIGDECLELMKVLADVCPKTVVAVDIPSGIHSNSGQIMGIALKAQITVTFGYEKLGCALYPGREYCGRLVICDIGFPDCRMGGKQYFTCEPSDLCEIPQRTAYSNKGDFGKVLVVAGSNGMSGAAYLSALAAYRTGAGLVRIYTDQSNRSILQQLLPEAVVSCYNPADALKKTEPFLAKLEALCTSADVVVLGPGMGVEESAAVIVEEVLARAYVPIVVDADGLNIIARTPRLTSYYTENIVITPHPAEMARLTKKPVGKILESVIEAAEAYAGEYGLTCVLKGAATVVAARDGKTYINKSGNSAMAKAGSGDVLTGVIAGLLALGLEEPEAAVLGVYLHGAAGDLAREEVGEHGVLAGELVHRLPAALKEKLRKRL